MPLLDYECGKCGHLERDVYVRSTRRKPPFCVSCGERMHRIFTGFNPHVFKPFWHPDMGGRNQVYIESKKQWKREAESRGLIPAALD